MELRILTFNIHHGKGQDNRVDLDRIARILINSNAQIIGLNEVDKTFGKRSQFEDQAAVLAEKLKMDYIFNPAISRKTKDNKTKEYGNVILSSMKIDSSHNYRLFSNTLSEPRGLLEASFTILGKAISVFITHLSINPFLQTRQVQQITEITQKKREVIVMGDFNFQPLSRNHQKICQSLKDSTEAGCFTYPATKPRKKLDYIFTSQNIRVVESRVLTAVPVASDHLPLMTTLYLDK